MAWLRLDEHVPENVKAQSLSLELFRFWINSLCISKEKDGRLPDLDRAAFRLRMTKPRVVEKLEQLRSVNMVDLVDGVYVMHDWGQWQFKSDVSSNRVKRLRETRKKRSTSVSGNGSALYSVSVSGEFKPDKQQTADAPQIPPDLVQSEYPQTLSTIRAVDPSVDETFVRGLAITVAQKILSHDKFPEHRREVATSDEWIARACRQSFSKGPKNHRAGLLLSTVPNILISWGVEKRQ